MALFVDIRGNSYYDSVSLMNISKVIEGFPGVERAMVCMGTDMNKELLSTAGLWNDAVKKALPSDLVIAFVLGNGDGKAVYAAVEEALKAKIKSKEDVEFTPASIASALKGEPDINLGIVSIPGEYAAAEAMRFVRNNVNVLIFSDNVFIEDEARLKKAAHEKGLLVMGPDCGTAIINGIGLCFANSVRSGNVGIVGASGTGSQEVSVQIDRLGGGISQLIGTGGRDLSKEVGGLMMLDALTMLAADPDTKVITLVSKPPVKEVADKVLAKAKKAGKPVVVCFLNSGLSGSDGNLHFVGTLEQAAEQAAALAGVKANKADGNFAALKKAAAGHAKAKPAGAKHVRGLFCGGTLCDEAAGIFRAAAGCKAYSNTSKKDDEKLKDPTKSLEHSFVDLGDDVFTRGKPHPMIDPAIRNARMEAEARDKTVSTILFDVVLGYGSHKDPAGVALEGVKKAKKAAGRDICFIGYVCGTPRDYQNMREQVAKLEGEGVLVAASNARAAELAALSIGGGK